MYLDLVSRGAAMRTYDDWKGSPPDDSGRTPDTENRAAAKRKPLTATDPCGGRGHFIRRREGSETWLAVTTDKTPGGRDQLVIETRNTDERRFTATKRGFDLDLIVGWIRTAFDKELAIVHERDAIRRAVAASEKLVKR